MAREVFCKSIAGVVVQALAAQSTAYVKQLRRLTSIAEGGAGDDDDEGSRGGDDEDEEAGGRDGDDALSVDSTGEIAWGRVIDLVKTQAATAANLRFGPTGEASDEPGRRRQGCLMLPLGLLLFLLPSMLIAPFYLVVYLTTVDAINNVQTAQVCCIQALRTAYS